MLILCHFRPIYTFLHVTKHLSGAASIIHLFIIYVRGTNLNMDLHLYSNRLKAWDFVVTSLDFRTSSDEGLHFEVQKLKSNCVICNSFFSIRICFLSFE